MRRPPLPLLLVSVALLAGCGSLAGGDAASPGTTAATTTGTSPAPERTSSTTPSRTPVAGSGTPGFSSTAYPPGVGPDGLTNLTALERANRRSLLRDGYVAVAARNATGTNGTSEYVVRVAAGPGGYPSHVLERERLDFEHRPGNETTERWANETVRLTRYVSDGDVDFEHQGNPEVGDTAAARVGLFSLLDAWEYGRVSVAGPPGDRRFTLTATAPAPDADRPEQVRLRDYHSTVVVDGNGTIRRASVVVKVTTPAGDRTIRTTYDLVAGERESVTRPAWVRERVGRVLDKSITATKVDARFVRVEHTGRAPIEAGTEFVMWYDGCGRAVGTLDRPFAPGETLYVYVSNETDEMGINRTGPDGPARPLDDPYSLSVYPPDRTGEVKAIADTNVEVPANATVDGAGASGASLALSAGVVGSTATGC